jgi:hypothetical protein
MIKYLFFFLIFSSFVFKAQPPGCASRNDILGNAGQAGLYGEYVAGYFADAPSYFTNTVSATRRVESNLNYTTNNWGAIVPPAGGSIADADNYSARCRGSIYIATAGVYTFYLTSDDASWMWIDNAALAYPTVNANALINNGGLHGDITISNSVNLTAGYHNIQIQFGEQGGGNHLIFEYSSTSPAIARTVVPNSILCTGIQPAIVAALPTPPPGCTCYAGVIGQYYTGYFADNQSFFTTHTNAINRLDANIGFNTDGGWGTVCPPLAGSNASPETYSTRFSGQIYVPTATTYTFYLTSDDASWMWINSTALATTPTNATALINNSGTHSAAMVSATIALTAGLHDFKIHYGENTGNNVCVLEYASSTITRQTIPQSAFCSCMSTINLPIELLNFTADVVDKSVLLQWQTASETNNELFEIERSTDGLNFKKINSLPSKSVGGNSLQKLSYSMVDLQPESGINYYRLKQVDFNGSFKYHKIVSVSLNKSNEVAFNIFPNPNNGSFVVSASGTTNNKNTHVLVYTIDGRVLYDQIVDPEIINDNSFRLNTDLKLVPGIYFVVLSTDDLYRPLKMIVE